MRFIESILLNNGDVKNLNYHQNRINKTFSHFFPEKEILNISEILNNKTLPKNRKYKIRIVYSEKEFTFEIQPYELPKIEKFNIKTCNSIEYNFKLEERKLFSLLKEDAQNQEIIIIKNNLVTDSSFSNLVFYDGKKWFTPTSYLLNGIRRQHLLFEKKITEKRITKNDIFHFEKIGIINAMIDLEEVTLKISEETIF